MTNSTTNQNNTVEQAIIEANNEIIAMGIGFNK